jgi:quinol monooxygenase YgiN
MPITVIADLALVPQQALTVVAKLQDILPETRAYDGCQGVRLLIDQDEPGHIVLVEEWDSRQDHARYMEWRRTSGTSPFGPEALAAPPHIGYFDSRD